MKYIKRLLSFLVFIIIIFVLTIGIFILKYNIQEYLFIQKKYIMWISKAPYNSLLLIFEFYIIIFFASKFNRNYKGLEKWLKKKARDNKIIFILINVVLLYVIIINIAVVSEDGIVDYSVLSPFGKSYTFEDIKKVNTGFYGSKIPYIRDKGEFYYYIEFEDGNKINLNGDSGGTYEELDSYEEIEKVDKILMSIGIQKISSLSNIDKNDLDDIYAERFRRIINLNK